MTANRFKQIIVHVGEMKTGSTHIQNVLAANAETLLSKGVLYPVAGPKMAAHHSLLRQLYDHAGAETLDIGFVGPPGDDEKILTMLESQNTTAPTVVLSSEALLNHAAANPERFMALDARLSSLAAKVRYVAYFRDPVSRFPSSCSQTLMRSALLPRYDWASKVRALLGLHKLVGDRFEVRRYERADFLHGDVLEDFLTGVVGADVAVSSLVPTTYSNISLSAEGMYIVQSIAFARQLTEPRNFPAHDAETRQWAQFLRRIGAKQNDHQNARMKSGIPELIVSASADDSNNLRKTFGIDLGLPASESPNQEKKKPFYHQLVRNVFVVQPDRTAALSEAVSNHPKCPDALRDALSRVTMPSA